MHTSQGPFPMETTYTWAGAAASRAHSHDVAEQGYPSGFGSLAAPVVSAAMRRANRKYLATLKRVIESAPRNHRYQLAQRGADAMQVDVRVDIDTAAEVAFDLMADARNERAGTPGSPRPKLTTAEPIAPPGRRSPRLTAESDQRKTGPQEKPWRAPRPAPFVPVPRFCAAAPSGGRRSSRRSPASLHAALRRGVGMTRSPHRLPPADTLRRCRRRPPLGLDIASSTTPLSIILA